MVKKKFDDSLLLSKKVKFLQVVEEASKSLGVNPPKVKFWKRDCPEYTGNERAHIHLDTKQICISELDLKHMTYDDIEETATHEVTHLTDTILETSPEHSDDFQQRHVGVKTKVWRPPTGHGLAEVGRSKQGRELKQKRKSKIDKTHCNYHLCRKKRKLIQCKYCKNYFCEEHLEPYEPGVYNPGSTKVENLILKYRVGGHPCYPYLHFLNTEREKENKEYIKALGNIFKSEPRKYEIHKFKLKDSNLRQQPITKSEVIKKKSWLKEFLDFMFKD